MLKEPTMTVDCVYGHRQKDESNIMNRQILLCKHSRMECCTCWLRKSFSTTGPLKTYIDLNTPHSMTLFVPINETKGCFGKVWCRKR